MPHIHSNGLMVLALAFLASPATAGPTSFDLTCSGQTAAPDGATTPFTARLSIDQKTKRWCYRDVGCSPVLPIISTQGGKMTLLAVSTPRNVANFDVDIKGGAFKRLTIIPARPDSARTTTGSCEVAPYTPIK
ncbi:MAG: hypothetical protein M3Y22_04350 [Pseudomonadota bacterium]|nr:hypothetical protein [Pseudomonadota bacterium]